MKKKMLFLPSGEYDSFGYQELFFGQSGMFYNYEAKNYCVVVLVSYL
jgi:hypothetical protein